MSLYEKISIAIGTINIISVILVAIQIHLSKRQAKKQHEELRCVKTVEVLRNWNDGLKKEARIAERIVEKFDENQCKQLYDSKAIKVDKELHEMICQMCSKNLKNCEHCKAETDGKFKITGSQLIELRGNVTSYLNNLEIVAVAWQQAIIDREVIEKQFSFLYDPGEKSALKNYRKVAGRGDSYAILSKFYDKIEKNQSKSDIKKKDEL